MNALYINIIYLIVLSCVLALLSLRFLRQDQITIIRQSLSSKRNLRLASI